LIVYDDGIKNNKKCGGEFRFLQKKGGFTFRLWYFMGFIVRQTNRNRRFILTTGGIGGGAYYIYQSVLSLYDRATAAISNALLGGLSELRRKTFFAAGIIIGSFCVWRFVKWRCGIWKREWLRALVNGDISLAQNLEWKMKWAACDFL